MLPRLLALMGSGETAPTMRAVHRGLLDRLGPAPVPAVLLDTPYGFQENADDLSARALAYFSTSVGAAFAVAGWRSADSSGDPVAREVALARLRDARYVFAGPGSPTYALRQWAGGPVPDALRDRLAPGGRGGCVTFASAAAITLGVAAVPVYEIYKVGADPHWLPGLDVLSAAGLRAAVVPHYDNAEGGNHDTRFCYLGERRLAAMEALLPAGAWVLGIDEHTACVLDLDAGTATVAGRGGVTVRAGGRSTVFAQGTVRIDDLRAAAEGSAEGAGREAGRLAATTGAPNVPAPPRAPLLAEAERLDDAFRAALGGGRVTDAVAAALELDGLVADWAGDSLEFDHRDRARSVLRGMVVRLGEAAVAGTRDPREVVGPLVEALVDARERARDAREWAHADALRDRLVAAGVDVRDTPDGPAWTLAPAPGGS